MTDKEYIAKYIGYIPSDERGWWTNTPERLYWISCYHGGGGWRASNELEMSMDLLALPLRSDPGYIAGNAAARKAKEAVSRLLDGKVMAREVKEGMILGNGCKAVKVREVVHHYCPFIEITTMDNEGRISSPILRSWRTCT